MLNGDVKTNYSAKELAGLPGMPGTVKGVIEKAVRENWPAQKRAGRGGGREYPATALPKETRDHLFSCIVTGATGHEPHLPATRPAQSLALVETPEPQALSALKKWQRDAMDARIYFMRLIEQADRTGLGVTQAIRTLVTQSHAGQLPPEAQAMVPVANKRSGTDLKHRALSERTLMRWWSEWNKAKKQPGALAPKAVENTELPAWAPYFLQAFQVPQKISVPQAMEQLAAILPLAMALPSEHQVRRFITKYSKLDINRGRMTGKELKELKGFTRRDTSRLQPLDVCLCDGHSFKAKIAHPVHGRPFLPEVCAVIDAATKVIIGWSAGLAESSQTVADAYRHAVTVNDEKRYGGIPAILYTDKGAGNEARVNSDPYTGMYARLGSTYRTGIPGNSQARGLIERAQASLWIRAAKKLATYTGRGMDEQVKRKVYLTLESDVKQALKAGREGKKSEILMGWQEFLTFCADEVEQYNRRPHTSLPKFTDSEGRRRHMCPLEMWSKWLADGWAPTVPEAAELDSLFRPHVTVTTRRGEVRLFRNTYYSGDLVHYNGDTVIVAYDIHDASRVWVKDLEERLIAVARFEANKRAFYPESAVEVAREGRLNRRLKLKELQISEIMEEANPAIEAAPTVIELPVELLAGEAARAEKVVQLAESRKLRDVSSPLDVYFLILDNIKAKTATTYQLQWKKDYEHFDETKKKTGLFLADPYCLKDGQDSKKAEV